MKIRTLPTVLFSAMFALPALACGPMPSGGSSGPSPQHKNYHHRRIKELKQKMHDYNSAQKWSDGLGYATGEMVPQMNRNKAEHRQFLIHHYEFLVHKEQLGKASVKDQIERRALESYLLNGGY